MRYKELKENPQTIKALAKQVASLPKNTSDRMLDKLSNAIALAQGGGEQNQYKQVSAMTKNIDDQDMKRYYGIVSKMMIGNDLTSKEITGIIKAINTNKCVNIKELMKPFNTVDKILAYYNNSVETRQYYRDMLLLQPAQRIGPGEILFATHDKRLLKGTKGDLTIVATGQEIEVKGGKTSGRFTDDDITPSGEYYTMSAQFIKKYKARVPSVPSGINYSGLIAGIQNNPNIATEILKDTQNIIKELWRGSPYVKNIIASIKKGDAETAKYYHGLANINAYFAAKQGGMGILFLRLGESPAGTSYAESLPKLLQIADIKVDTTYPITTVKLNPFPKMGVVPKQ